MEVLGGTAIHEKVSLIPLNRGLRARGNITQAGNWFVPERYSILVTLQPTANAIDEHDDFSTTRLTDTLECQICDDME